MAEAPTQTYATHVHRPRLAGVAGLFALIGLALVIVELVRRPTPLAWGGLCLAAAVWCLVVISRVYIVRLQDRIILLEMRTRLARLGRESDYGRLTARQLIALRFASDRELPPLIERAVAEKLSSREIKQAISDWQPDYLRT